MQVYRLDDVPLIYEQLQELKLQDLIDKSVVPHGNWQGISLGHLLTIWLCYLLSEGDHRLSRLENWVECNLLWLQSMTGLSNLTSKDFTDDRLESALDYLSKEEKWLSFQHLFEGNSLSIYDLEPIGTLRLDAAPFQGHHKIIEGGLFQKGYCKQHANIGQFKVMLATLDNTVNNFAYPLFHKVFSGEKADDILYLPVLKECVELLGTQEAKLVVGDSKMGSKSLRSYIKESGHYYLVPLSKVQLNDQRRKSLIMSQDKSKFERIYKEKKGQQTLVCQGFESSQKVEYEDGQIHQWEERLLFVLSTSYSKSQCANFDKKIVKAKEELVGLTQSKQGKQIIKNKEDLTEKIQGFLAEKSLTDYLEVIVSENIEIKHKRKYKDRPAFDKKIITYQVEITENKQAIEEKKKLLGWQVYACCAPEEKLSFEQCVWKYRGQNRIESRFDSLRNKVAPLLPVFLQKDNRIIGLVNLLMIALKTCSMMEYKAAKNLKKEEEKLTNVYPGNPKMGTKTPTAKRMLDAFTGISLVVIKKEQTNNVNVAMTEINHTQKKIISLIGFKSGIYEDIIRKIKIRFST